MLGQRGLGLDVSVYSCTHAMARTHAAAALHHPLLFKRALGAELGTARAMRGGLALLEPSNLTTRLTIQSRSTPIKRTTEGCHTATCFMFRSPQEAKGWKCHPHDCFYQQPDYLDHRLSLSVLQKKCRPQPLYFGAVLPGTRMPSRTLPLGCSPLGTLPRMPSRTLPLT